jgi:hypothetical protein
LTERVTTMRQNKKSIDKTSGVEASKAGPTGFGKREMTDLEMGIGIGSNLLALSVNDVIEQLGRRCLHIVKG